MDIQKELFYKEFVQRENDFIRAPYDPEIEFYSTIKSGNVENVRKLCKDAFINKSGLGKLSDNPLQNIKFHFVVTTALVARYCISGGMDHSVAYSLSDFYIQKADHCTKIDEISDLHNIMCVDYAKKMQNLKKKTVYSKQIANCIDYIYDNLHARIKVEELADHAKLNPSYLSRLFKQELGISISEYIRIQKLETAKKMLVYSDYRPAQIASILAFPSQSYFTEIFRKYTGLTPSKYQKENYRSPLSDSP